MSLSSPPNLRGGLRSISCGCDSPSLAARRERITAELLESEEKYLQYLRLLTRHFEAPLRLSEDLMPGDAHSAVFGNLSQIVQLNRELLQLLQQQRRPRSGIGTAAAASATSPAHAFCQLAPYLKIYSVYARQHMRAQAILECQLAGNARLAGFVRRAESRPEVQMRLGALLIMPVQRVPRYEMLLTQLLRCTPTGHPDYPALQRCVAQVAEVARHINDTVRSQQSAEELLDIQRSLRRAPRLLAPGRSLLKRGVLKKVATAGGEARDRDVMLFTDILLYARPPPESLCCSVLPLHHCRAERLFDGGASLFSVSCKSHRLLLFCPDAAVAEDWLGALEDAIRKVQSNRQSLRKESSAKRPMRGAQFARFERRLDRKRHQDTIGRVASTSTLTAAAAEADADTASSEAKRRRLVRRSCFVGDSVDVGGGGSGDGGGGVADFLCVTPRRWRQKASRAEEETTMSSTATMATSMMCLADLDDPIELTRDDEDDEDGEGDSGGSRRGSGFRNALKFKTTCRLL